MLPYGSITCIRFKGLAPLRHLSPHWGTPSIFIFCIYLTDLGWEIKSGSRCFFSQHWH